MARDVALITGIIWWAILIVIVAWVAWAHYADPAIPPSVLELSPEWDDDRPGHLTVPPEWEGSE